MTCRREKGIGIIPDPFIVSYSQTNLHASHLSIAPTINAGFNIRTINKQLACKLVGYARLTLLEEVQIIFTGYKCHFEGRVKTKSS